MFDHGRGFDMLAPLLAEQYFVTAIDSRGHGDSGWADTYLWQDDIADLIRVIRDIGRPVHLVGHSKGGGQVTDAALMEPDAVLRLVNLDGFGPPDDDGFKRPGGPDHSKLTMAERCGAYLDRRRQADRRLSWSTYSSFEELVERRGKQNPNLDKAWLRYFVHHAARELEGGWVWKADPQMVAGGFGPFRPDWIAPNWQHLRAPMLAVIGSIEDTWGPIPEETLAGRLSYVPDVTRATVDGSGHFIHMERPAQVASLVLDFLAER
jgi:pimeloyl-ACP methyl ester carboxylesterase